MSANNVTKIHEFPNNTSKRQKEKVPTFTIQLHNSPKRDGLNESKPAASTSSFLCPSSREHPLKNAKHSFISLDGGLGFPSLRHAPHNAYSIFCRPLKFSGNSTSLKICLCLTATQSSDSLDCCLAKLLLRFLRATVVKWNVARGKVTTDNFGPGCEVKILGFRHTNAGCFAICARGTIAETTCMMQCNVLHRYFWPLTVFDTNNAIYQGPTTKNTQQVACRYSSLCWLEENQQFCLCNPEVSLFMVSRRNRPKPGANLPCHSHNPT